MDKLFISLGLIITGLSLGYTVQTMCRNNTLTLPLSIPDLRIILQKIAMFFFMPISFLVAVWAVTFSDIRVAFMPFIGILALVTGGILGLLFSKVSGKPDKQTGVLFCCGSFTNIGSIGGLVCYMFLGEPGFAMIALYKMFEEPIYYTIGFPIARFYSGASKDKQTFTGRIIGVITDPFVFTILAAFFIGLFLNLMDITRPGLFDIITAIFIPVGTFLLIVSIGLGMRLSSVTTYLSDSIAISVIKFTIVPVLACSAAYLAGLHQIDNGLPFKVVLILSSMPVAFNALVAASIYDLDLDLANSCWLVTTACLIVVLPVLYVLINLL